MTNTTTADAHGAVSSTCCFQGSVHHIWLGDSCKGVRGLAHQPSRVPCRWYNPYYSRTIVGHSRHSGSATGLGPEAVCFDQFLEGDSSATTLSQVFHSQQPASWHHDTKVSHVTLIVLSEALNENVYMFSSMQ